MSSWVLPSPRAMRKCATRRKCYVELDSDDEEEDARGLDEDDQDDNDCENKDDDVIIDEERSTPAKGLRAFAFLEVQHTEAPFVVGQAAQLEDNASKLFKSLPLEVCCISHMILTCRSPNPKSSVHFHLHPPISLLSPATTVCLP
jgi:hypothetical protein